MTHQTIRKMLVSWAQRAPDAPAIEAPGRSPLSYRQLDMQCQLVQDRLARLGIGIEDRVGIVLPNGPEMATAFLGAACGVAAAPLNPSFKRTDFEFYLSDLNASALIANTEQTAAVEAAASLGIPCLKVEITRGAAAGSFDFIEGAANGEGAVQGNIREPDSDTIAMLLHTSGTTSRPKLVPLTQANILSSARNIGNCLELAPADKCLNVMPLFHIHGLVAALLATINAGGSILCTPGFDAESFGTWLEDHAPTWYTAVPTIHQSVLAALGKTQPPHQMRFVRSSSASLPPSVLDALENLFRIPVIEAYGMTEAAHQMSSNPLPPLERKAGRVGLPAGPEMAVMDEKGALQPPGVVGEIVIRGENVTPGYLGNPEANANAFSDGWFRTGDQGSFDEQGYLAIKGRLKEMINRGGEKIAPREIDEAMLQMKKVSQAVAFAVPHPTLGEDIVCAVVPRPEATMAITELREHAFESLPDFKVPSHFLLVDQIPKGPTGKVQRIHLADLLLPGEAADEPPPETESEQILARIWNETLDCTIASTSNFFLLGGDSLTAGRVASRIEQVFEIELPIADLFRNPTLETQARHIEGIIYSHLEARK